MVVVENFKFQNVPTLWMFDTMGIFAEFAQLVVFSQIGVIDALIPFF